MARDRALQMNAVSFAFLACGIVTMGLRLYVRTRIIKCFGSDDIVMIFGLLAFTAFVAIQYESTRHGLGQHIWDMDIQEILSCHKHLQLSYIAYGISIALIRVSIGLFLLRFAIERSHRWIIYIAMLSTVIFCTALVLFVSLICHPLGNSHHCVSIGVEAKVSYLYSAAAILIDLVFAVFPIFLIWSLRISRRTKIMLIPIFGMGFLASIAVMCRLAYIEKSRQTLDYFYVSIDIEIWTMVELGLAALAGNLLTLRPLYRKIARALGFSPSNDTLNQRRLKSIVIRASWRSAASKTGSSSKTDKSSIAMSQDDALPLHALQPAMLAEELGDAPFVDIGLEAADRKKIASKSLDIESRRARLSIIPE